MLRIELRAALPAGAERAWQALLDTAAWQSWGGLVTAASGDLAPGSRWTVELRGQDGGRPRRMRPRLLAVDAPRSLLFETCIGPGWLVRMQHRFTVEPVGPGRSVLLQDFTIEGLLSRPLMRPLRRGCLQFAELGEDLARHLGEGGGRSIPFSSRRRQPGRPGAR